MLKPLVESPSSLWEVDLGKSLWKICADFNRSQPQTKVDKNLFEAYVSYFIWTVYVWYKSEIFDCASEILLDLFQDTLRKGGKWNENGLNFLRIIIKTLKKKEFENLQSSNQKLQDRYKFLALKTPLCIREFEADFDSEFFEKNGVDLKLILQKLILEDRKCFNKEKSEEWQQIQTRWKKRFQSMHKAKELQISHLLWKTNDGTFRREINLKIEYEKTIKGLKKQLKSCSSKNMRSLIKSF